MSAKHCIAVTGNSTFLTFKEKLCTSGLGRLLSFSQILYKNFMYFRVWGNYGHTPDTWHGHVIGQCTSQFGQKKTFSTNTNGDPKAAVPARFFSDYLTAISSQPSMSSPLKVIPVRQACSSPDSIPDSLVSKCNTISRSPSPSTSSK
jgi:hypothetical protein